MGLCVNITIKKLNINALAVALILTLTIMNISFKLHSDEFNMIRLPRV